MPLPILRKIPQLHQRILPFLPYASNPAQTQLFQNNINTGIGNATIGNTFSPGNGTTVPGYLNNDNDHLKPLFDGSTSTFSSVKHNDKRNWLMFDLGKNRTIDKIRIKSPQPNVNEVNTIGLFYQFWTHGQNPQTESPFLTDANGPSYDHNDTNYVKQVFSTNSSISNANVYGTGETLNAQYVGIRMNGSPFLPSVTHWNFGEIEIIESFDTRDFNVEFNDSVLDLQGWAGPRYKGCKTLGKKVNEYHPSSSTWTGDITYGLNPNVENKTTALYYTTTVIGGKENPQYANIKHHSYINVEKIVIINYENDTVRILDKDTTDFNIFHRYLTNDFPTGGKFSGLVLSDNISSALKSQYTVKMNKGWLYKSFSYNAEHGPLPGMNKEGAVPEYLEQTSGDIDNVRYAISNPLALYDALSGSIQAGTVGDNIRGYYSSSQATSTAKGYDDDYYNPCFINGNCANGTVGLYGCVYDDTLASEWNCENNVSAAQIDSLFNIFSYGPYYGALSSSTPSYGNAPSTEYEYDSNSVYSQNNGGQLRFRYGVMNSIDDNTPSSYVFQPLYVGENTKIIDNKFTRQFVDPANDASVAVNTFDLPYIEEVEYIVQEQFYKWYKDPEHNPSQTASLFIGNCIQFLNSQSMDTELHLTLFEGTKDFSGLDDELSISTFEVDKNLNANYLDFEYNRGPRTAGIGPRAKYIRLKNQPQFKPNIEPKYPNRHIYEIIETTNYRTLVEERQNAFVYGPGTPASLHENTNITIGSSHVSTYDNSNANSNNFSGSFQYELSFLDKDHTLIADVDKDVDLEHGLGGEGMILIPEHAHEMVKANVFFYLEKAGIVDKTTTKKIITNID